MTTREEFENTMYHQKLAHKSWMDKAFLRGNMPSDEPSQLVWELLIGYSEALENWDSAREEVHNTAYDLAKIVLDELPIDQVYVIYRDYVLEAMINYSQAQSVEHCRTLVKFTNEISNAFSEAYSSRLKRTIRHSRAESISRELKIAKQIQSHLLPKNVPTIEGFDFAGRLIPAAEVGGDYWSIRHYKEDGIVTVKLADISGHGIAAATLVAAVKFVSGGYYRRSETAQEVMRQTNRVLTRDTPHDILITMVYGWIWPKTHDITFVNAGHSPAFLCREDSCSDIAPTGPILGITEDAEYTAETIRLQKNDIVFFGSDGITEAGIGEQFGLARLKQVVSQNAKRSADEIADAVIAAVKDFAKQPHDDISMLIIKVTSDAPQSD